MSLSTYLRVLKQRPSPAAFWAGVRNLAITGAGLVGYNLAPVIEEPVIVKETIAEVLWSIPSLRDPSTDYFRPELSCVWVLAFPHEFPIFCRFLYLNFSAKVDKYGLLNIVNLLVFLTFYVVLPLTILSYRKQICECCSDTNNVQISTRKLAKIVKELKKLKNLTATATTKANAACKALECARSRKRKQGDATKMVDDLNQNLVTMAEELKRLKDLTATATANANAASMALKRAETRELEQAGKQIKATDKLSQKLTDFAEELKKCKDVAATATATANDASTALKQAEARERKQSTKHTKATDEMNQKLAGVAEELKQCKEVALKAIANTDAASTALKRAETREREQASKHTKEMDELNQKLSDMAKELQKCKEVALKPIANTNAALPAPATKPDTAPPKPAPVSDAAPLESPENPVSAPPAAAAQPNAAPLEHVTKPNEAPLAPTADPSAASPEPATKSQAAPPAPATEQNAAPPKPATTPSAAPLEPAAEPKAAPPAPKGNTDNTALEPATTPDVTPTESAASPTPETRAAQVAAAAAAKAKHIAEAYPESSKPLTEDEKTSQALYDALDGLPKKGTSQSIWAPGNEHLLAQAMQGSKKKSTGPAATPSSATTFPARLGNGPNPTGPASITSPATAATPPMRLGDGPNPTGPTSTPSPATASSNSTSGRAPNRGGFGFGNNRGGRGPRPGQGLGRAPHTGGAQPTQAGRFQGPRNGGGNGGAPRKGQAEGSAAQESFKRLQEMLAQQKKQ